VVINHGFKSLLATQDAGQGESDELEAARGVAPPSTPPRSPPDSPSHHPFEDAMKYLTTPLHPLLPHRRGALLAACIAGATRSSRPRSWWASVRSARALHDGRYRQRSLEIKKLIDNQGTAWEEFKKTNDALMKAKADGKAVGELETKLSKISATSTRSRRPRARWRPRSSRIQREGLAGGGGKSKEDAEVELKSFNLHAEVLGAGKRPARTSTADLHRLQERVLERSCARATWRSHERGAEGAAGGLRLGRRLPHADAAVGRVVQKVFELSPIRQIASVVQEISDRGARGHRRQRRGLVRLGGGARRPRTETNTPQVGKYRIEAHEMYAAPKATQKLLDDAAVDVEAWLAGKVANKFARVEAPRSSPAPAPASRAASRRT
jgi:predicted phage gp36 major capsid-like protein